MHLGRGYNNYPDSDTNISVRIDGDARMSMNSRYMDSHRTSASYAWAAIGRITSVNPQTHASQSRACDMIYEIRAPN